MLYLLTHILRQAEIINRVIAIAAIALPDKVMAVRNHCYIATINWWDVKPVCICRLPDGTVALGTMKMGR